MPRECLTCQPKKNRKRAALRAAARGDELGALLGGGEMTGEALRSWAPVLLAAGLAVNDDPKRAAQMVGLPDDLDLEEVEAEARRDFSDVIEMRSEGYQRLALLASTVTMARLLPSIGELPIGQLAPTLKALMDSAERLQGAVAPTFGNLTVVLNERAPLSSDSA